MKIRKIAKQDNKEYEALRNLWVQIFEDQPEEVDSLYDNLSAAGYILLEDDSIASCLTTYQAGTFEGRAVIVIYAVCTGPEHRGKGYASELLNQVQADLASDDNIIIVCPREPSLNSFYNRNGFQPFCYSCEREVSISQDEIDVPSVIVKTINYKQYGKYREAFLKDCPHVTPRDELLKQAQEFSINSNGMLLINNGDAICIVDGGTEDEMYISELLVNPLLLERSLEITNEIALSLAAKFETSKVIYRTISHIIYTDISGDHPCRGTFVQAMSGNFEQQNSVEIMEPYYGLTLE